jgi:O-acetylserine/cysteine efflux transporter
MNTNRRRAIAALTGAGLLWGATVPLSKLALEWLPAGWLTATRFGLAAAVLLAVARPRLRAACTPLMLGSGAVGYGGTVIVQNTGIARTSVTHAALLIGAAPVLVAVIAAVWQHTVARPVAWAGFALSLAGVGLVTADGAGAGATLRGDGLVLASVLLAATFTAYQARLLPGRDPVAVTAVQFLGAALGALAVTLITEGGPTAPPSAGPVLAVAALAVAGTVAPFTLFAYGQSRVPAQIAGAFLNLEPLVGAMAGVVVFGNPVGPAQVTGGVAILAGIGLSSLPLVAGRGRPARVRTEQGQVGGSQPVAPGLGHVRRPDVPERSAAAEGHRARGHPQTQLSQCAIFRGRIPPGRRLASRACRRRSAGSAARRSRAGHGVDGGRMLPGQVTVDGGIRVDPELGPAGHLPRDLGRDPQGDHAIGDDHARRHRSAAGDQGPAADDRAVEHRGAVSDQRLRADDGAVHHAQVADGRPFTDLGHGIVAAVQDRPVLDVCSPPHDDRPEISPQDGPVPDRRLGLHAHVPHQGGGGRDPRLRADLRLVTAERE